MANQQEIPILRFNGAQITAKWVFAQDIITMIDRAIAVLDQSNVILDTIHAPQFRNCEEPIKSQWRRDTKISVKRYRQN